MKNGYQRAKSYAWSLDRDYYRDIVHDAYLVWHKKTGRNLFDEPDGVVIQTIKYQHGGDLTRQTFMYRGEIFKKILYAIEDDFYYEEDGRRRANTFVPLTRENPETLYLYAEAIEEIRLTLKGRAALVFEGLMLGYNQSEIAIRLGVYRQIVQYEVKVIKKLLSDLGLRR